MATDINLQSFFDKRATDNNNKSVTDVNAGIRKIFQPLIDTHLIPQESYMISEFEDGYPDLVAKNCMLKSVDYWWWLLATNGHTDPLTQCKMILIYYIASKTQIQDLIEQSDIVDSDSEKDRMGSVVELN